ncbi:hypothetical protein CPB84DRAFT_1757948 [Gymnopilus junonius]|uniref:Uncharacterized protein n=1 Tax=Gymnopilus junonius TaxID=109634 RepID=A0A9P5TTS8_GYMJU|nr:hypothetical protein CPB84DRAFT_1757948 [Gymnopilus junonius]
MLPHNLAVHDLGISDGALPGPSPDPSSRGKRSSSIPYHSAAFPFREPKDRSSHRTGKSLIIVIPPSTLIQEHGRHGHTLSNGPYHRLSQGVVMPLFPSLFGQLTAIAREYNFPSTSGLCLYLHYVEDGFTLTPRITDDSWQALWSHLSEPLRPNEHRTLIGGKVEFDIDLRLARWYTSWLTTIQREISEYPTHSYPATAPSLAHFRRESSLADSRHFDDDLGENPTVLQHSAPIGRHVPRKLSLVERFDISTARPEAKVNLRSVGSPHEPAASNTHTLSTIVQEEEPQTARRHLDHRVNSWRANAVVSPIPLAATGQTSLDPPNLPNDMSIDTPVEPLSSPIEEEMRLEDYAWSVSSLGPQSPLEISTSSWSYPPSVHIASRMEGSVLLTPSTCTSFGPLDDDYLSLASEPFSRVQSPDIAHRFYEDCPPTPTTATSWGAPLSYPPSPRCVSPVPSLDIGERCMFSTDLSTSALEVSAEKPWTHVWPYIHEQRNSTADDRTLSSEKPWSYVWPYIARQDGASSESRSQPWPHVWPYSDTHSGESVPWPYVWPYRDIHSRESKPWPHVWPYNSVYPRKISISDGLQQSFGYPYINIYRPVYPHLEIYPSVPGSMERSLPGHPQRKLPSVQIRLPSNYPTIDLYPAVYPYNLDAIYPLVLQTKENRVGSAENYPSFNIYPAIKPPFFTYLSLPLCIPPSRYPDLKIYPEIATDSDAAFTRQGLLISSERSLSQSVHLQTYPSLNIYPAVYPYFDLYPSVALQVRIESSKRPASSLVLERLLSQNAHLQRYPVLNIYPAVYPHFDLYPSLALHTTMECPKTKSLKQVITLHVAYPRFNLYPAVYPYFDIYPVVYMDRDDRRDSSNQEARPLLSDTSPPSYPSFNLYPATYPYFDIYPASYGVGVNENKNPLERSPFSGYPYFNLYPRVYPYLDIYPAPYSSRMTAVSDIIPSKPGSSDPVSNLYPTTHSHSDLHGAREDVVSPAPVRKSRNSSRLTHAELHAVVMMEKRGSFGRGDPIQALQEKAIVHDSQISSINKEEMRHHIRQSSNSGASRNGFPSSTVSIDDPRRLSLSYRQGGGGLVPKVPTKPEILRSSSLREQANLRSFVERDASRSTSLRESSPKSSFGLPPRPTPRRRDSIVLQRVKVFDPEESSAGLSKETLAKFPMPPGPPKGFPTLPISNQPR